MAFEGVVDKSAADVLVAVKSTTAGLTTDEAHARLITFGQNVLSAERVPWWRVLGRQFTSSFVLLLFIAAGLSFALSQRMDGSFILLFVIINAALGFVQEYHSEHTLALLRRYVVPDTRVLRQGKEEVIATNELVPGDIVLLEAGDRVPADVRWIDLLDLTIDESALTGESVPVKKTTGSLVHDVHDAYQAGNLGFSGTTVLSGSGTGVVFATGRKTAMGSIAKLTVETARVSLFQKELDNFSTFILRLAVATLTLVFLANVLIERNAVHLVQLLIFSIALAVSVVPEALPVVATFALSQGARRLAKHKVVIKRLSAIHDLGSIEVLCTDKTGTITENKLTVVDTLADDSAQVVFYAALCAEPMHGKRPQDPFDAAVTARLLQKHRAQLKGCRRLNTIPFDPKRRRNSVLVVHNHDAGRELVIRGAPESVMEACHLSKKDHEEQRAWMQEQGKLGRRVIAVAMRTDVKGDTYTPKDEEANMQFLGLISFEDPIKKTAVESVRRAEKLGVKIKILTGDAPEVAGAVAAEVGLVHQAADVITGEQLEALSEAKQLEAVEVHTVFARVSPEQKYKIIHLLQSKHNVGFLGEGINDAPALKAAHVAIAVSNASDIAREAADIILMQKGLGVIIDGIHEGRDVYANVIKYIRAALTGNMGNFFSVAVASLFINYLPMLPLQILLVNLLTDLPFISIATDTNDPKDVRSPETYKLANIVRMAMLLGLISSVFDFIFFGVFSAQGAGVLQTCWFIGSVLTELFFLFSVRTRRFFFLSTLPSLPIILLTVICGAIAVLLPLTGFAHNAFQFVKPSQIQLMTIFGIAIAYFVCTDVVKVIFYRRSAV